MTTTKILRHIFSGHGSFIQDYLITLTEITHADLFQIVPLADNVTEVATTMAMTPNGTDAEKEMVRDLEYKDGMNVLGKLLHS